VNDNQCVFYFTVLLFKQNASRLITEIGLYTFVVSTITLWPGGYVLDYDPHPITLIQQDTIFIVYRYTAHVCFIQNNETRYKQQNFTHFVYNK